MDSNEALRRGAFRPGFDPRRGVGYRKHAKLRKRLATFDETAWETLRALFESDDLEFRKEALRFWGKYRLAALADPGSAVNTQGARPRMNPDVAARLAEMDS